jgi:UV DNA damage endonuclease
VRWQERYASELAALGRRILAAGIRVSMHPGQYTVLNSPTPAIVAASVAELDYHAQLLDALGTTQESKIVLHIGGLYGDAPQVAMDRFLGVAEGLPRSVLRRLVIENDDRLFDADAALFVARRLGVPVVFDWLHHHAHPAGRPVAEVIADVTTTWTPADGPPKVHLSTQAANAPAGAHADVVDASDVQAFLAQAPDGPIDVMLEAKQKDLALLRLRRELLERGVRESDLS